MRIPVSSANFRAPVYINGGARNRVSVGESRENEAKKIEFDTNLGMCLIWPKREERLRTVSGKQSGQIGLIVARPDSFNVLVEDMGLLEVEAPKATVKPGGSK